MRRLLLAFLLAASCLAAADVTLTDGRVLRDFSVVQISEGYATIRHRGGMAKIERRLLPAELAAQVPRRLSDEEASIVLDGWRKISIDRRLEGEHRAASIMLRLWDLDSSWRLSFFAYDLPIVGTTVTGQQHFSCPAKESQKVRAAFEKYRDWSRQAMVGGIRTISREIAEIDGQALRLEMETRGGVMSPRLVAGSAFYSDEDVARFLVLLSEVPGMFEELRSEMENAKRAVDLK